MVASVFTNLLLPLTTPPGWREKLEIDLTTLGVSAFMQTLLDDTSATAALATLGIVSGTYTPTLFNTTNVGASTALLCTWLRVNDRVMVSGYVEVDPTAAAGTATTLGMSLPVASNFTTTVQCAGPASGISTNQSVGVLSDPANDRATFNFAAQISTNFGIAFSFMYPVI